MLSGLSDLRLTPCSLVPALILWIHKDRQSRFFSFLPTYACCRAVSTRLRAMVMQFLALFLNALANSSTFCLLRGML